MSYLSCLEKQKKIKELFSDCSTQEDKYKKIIELGQEANPLSPKYKSQKNLVSGCQSVMFLHSFIQDGRVYFEAESDALISAGLAILLTKVYSGETPETILKCAPDYIEELGIHKSLTPNRANGLYHIHMKMKQDALKYLTN